MNKQVYYIEQYRYIKCPVTSANFYHWKSVKTDKGFKSVCSSSCAYVSITVAYFRIKLKDKK